MSFYNCAWKRKKTWEEERWRETLCLVWKWFAVCLETRHFFFPSMAWFLTGTTDLGAETTLTLWLCSTLTNFFLMYCEWNQVHWDAASVPRTSCGYQENLCLALHFQQCFHCQLSTLTQYLGSLKISQAILSPPYCSDNCWSWSQATLM